LRFCNLGATSKPRDSPAAELNHRQRPELRRRREGCWRSEERSIAGKDAGFRLSGCVQIHDEFDGQPRASDDRLARQNFGIKHDDR
jgi:hypothetical protein